MSVEIKVPALPESVADATVATWHKKEGDAVSQDETIVDLETDKVVLEVPAPASGVIGKINKGEGETVTADEILGLIEEGATVVVEKSQDKPAKADEKNSAAPAPAKAEKTQVDASPSVRKMMVENDVKAGEVTGTGKGGKITKDDVHKALGAGAMNSRGEKREPMTRMRARIAERLLQVKQETAMLTTFNEVNMKAVMDIRKQYKDAFLKKHDIKLGFMSFFTKAVTEALKLFPAVNASIDGNDIVYHNYCDIGIAVSSPRGLVVPVLRNAESMTMAEIEQNIIDYAVKARNGKLSLEEMTGGTFTITNGGTFGSMLSTPIINAPQSAILGMHNIVERPVAENGEVVIRPVMYLALSYDHRIIDGKDSVSFLRTIKEFLEDPARMLLNV